MADQEPSKEVIVVAEDSPPNRKILCHLLEKLGYEVVGCEDGEVALKAIEEHKDANIVAVISDIMMPKMDGIELLKKVRSIESQKDTPFVLVTAVSDREYIVEAKALGVNGYILKPVTFQRVTSKLQELFPGKQFPNLAA
ncbi:MAG: response regulator [Bdellovibrionaceae bacterium]|nr:response regulator [Pseudobdellovibrionaceae bacterium]|tara:strand:- start:278 stop:697 length:420 start_codon:yes stop_codon:yes gene_type:complete